MLWVLDFLNIKQQKSDFFLAPVGGNNKLYSVAVFKIERLALHVVCQID